MRARAVSVEWIPALAEPYLRGFAPRLARHGALRGCWFSRTVSASARAASSSRQTLGFFAGFLFRSTGFEFLRLDPPESVVFVFVRPVGAGAHRRLVREPGSLIRWTFDYIRWLTHRPPRFEFHERELPALVRHCSLSNWPHGREEHYARNYFVETLALLVRSGLVRRLREWK